jgi:Xaa-Pro aminopeptidase
MRLATGPDLRPRPIISPFAFPVEEYRQRVARARAAMAAQGVDALLVTEDRNVFYFTGAGGAQAREDKARPAAVLIPRQGEVVALVPHSRGIAFREASWVGELRTYDDLAKPVLHQARVRLIEEAGPGARTIGMELGYEQRLGMSVADYEGLKAALPAHRFADASLLLWNLRFIKSPAELARIERAIRVTDQAYAAVFPTLRPGMTEREIIARFQGEMARLGATASWASILSGTYDRFGYLVRERVVEAGEMVWIDMGANVLGYWADFSRGAVLGQPTPHQRDMQQKVREVTLLAIEAVKPGLTMTDIARVCDREMARRGLVFNTWAVRYGHGMGLQTTEPPHVGLYDETVIAPGMVLNLEPGMCTPEGRFQIEENGVVTETGYRCLTRSPRELVAVPL